ncbi:segregation and condensation protein A [Geodermatophilus sabuli]|uniref:Segregation and condensation protein A n=1 Tax=Geodermatophilus sabuli TaxID=1564158 RepID=A0A285ED67_9ACTN|nr:ScpA family protein [Geodermatophilus sabuli]MBB3084730.1 segregation and condensation protein A [Geodermatophilus sabuli]SNX97082.1 condensin subunit ScpA [Geodermatophilus sabuli]
MDGNPAVADPAPSGRFTVRLTNFEGPFDLLLQLIGKHKLDVTEIALSQVTDEFIAHLRALGDELHLDQASEFLVVAATLLDLKAARLLPAADVEDEEDLELLEARDLLFARLLQYKAYKQAATFLREREAEAIRRHPRDAALEPRFAELLPEVLLGVTPEQFAALAARALAPKAPAVVGVSHLHAPAVSVAEQLLLVRNQLMGAGTTTFRALTADCGHTLEVIARFLALLELYRQQRVAFEQLTPLGELHVRWTGGTAPEPDADVDAAAHADEEYA